MTTLPRFEVIRGAGNRLRFPERTEHYEKA
jgi:hypothetical protein